MATAPRRRPTLVPRRFPSTKPPWPPAEEVSTLPYRFARFGVRSGGFLDLSADGNDERLQQRSLPVLRTPQDLAEWLNIPLGKLAWLIHRFEDDSRPPTEQQAHYHFRWERKRSGGWRLLEAPKPTLKAVQSQILEEILNRIEPHSAAHGFVAGRSILTNAREHLDRAVVVRYDLSNFYATVTLSRVVAIFRAAGYAREAAVWLARLCTSCIPQTIAFPDGQASAIRPFLPRHLPQGAPTSPALANLSAYRLDLRLTGLARAFGGTYTRYADDITFSGPAGFRRSLSTFLPLVERIIVSERFRVNWPKRRVVKPQSRQMVTGVVVNVRPNVPRHEYDRLKAILTNCVRSGPTSQNRAQHPDFQAHLRGRIAHVHSLNPERGAKLLAIFQRIHWD